MPVMAPSRVFHFDDVDGEPVRGLGGFHDPAILASRMLPIAHPARRDGGATGRVNLRYELAARRKHVIEVILQGSIKGTPVDASGNRGHEIAKFGFGHRSCSK